MIRGNCPKNIEKKNQLEEKYLVFPMLLVPFKAYKWAWNYAYSAGN